MMNEQGAHQHCHWKRLSWTAVIVGALVGVGLTFLLFLFSAAIGLSAFAVDSTTGAVTLVVGGFIGVVIAILVSMFVAGWVAGYLGRPYTMGCNLGVLYGFTAWCLALLITASFAGPIGRYVASYTYFVSTSNAMVFEMRPPVVIENVTPVKATATTPAANQKATTSLAMGAFIVFVLFFLGALASCFGGSCGMSCCKKDDASCNHEHTHCK